MAVEATENIKRNKAEGVMVVVTPVAENYKEAYHWRLRKTKTAELSYLFEIFMEER